MLTGLLPSLLTESVKRVNVFDVLHHGTHEKQLSNLFAWLLDEHGSHKLGNRFVTHFTAEVNSELRRLGEPPITSDSYIVTQEQNTAGEGSPADIADIVLLG